VGDAEFRKKCLGKMDQVADGGRTVIFVSHNMESISRLSTRALYLSGGRAKYVGEVEEAVENYLGGDAEARTGFEDLTNARRSHQIPPPILTSVTLRGEESGSRAVFNTGEPFQIKIGYSVPEPLESAYFAAHLVTSRNRRIMSLFSHHDADALTLRGAGAVLCHVDELRLVSGNYYLDLAVGTRAPVPQVREYIPRAIGFEVRLGDYLNGGRLLRTQGVVAQKSHWHTAGLSAEIQGEMR
jgi:lipopolysaccharide transport system ATP-binding protein